jgi:MFS family permease
VIQLALGWTMLEATGSPFYVGLVAAIRAAPQVPLGIPAGIVADWLDRRLLLIGVTLASMLVALTAATSTGIGVLAAPVILSFAALFGLLDTLRTTVTQAYAYDLVRAERAARGLANINLGAQLLGSAGGIAGGYVLEVSGAAAAFGLVALVLTIGAMCPWWAGRVAPFSTPVADTGAPRRSDQWRERPSFSRAVGMIVRSRLLLALVIAIILAEVLGFSSQALFPVFARDVFDTGAAGLGQLTAMRFSGGVLALLIISRIGTTDRTGMAMTVAAVMLGATLVAFAQSPRWELALFWILLVGACCATIDTLAQVLLQQRVADHERGAAMGIWVFSIGFGPAGFLAIGALADVAGAPLAQTTFGVALVVVMLPLLLYAPLRTLK